MNSQPSDKLSALKRFAIGILIGLVIAGLYWVTSIYFNIPISLAQGIIGSSLLAISFGILLVFVGIDKVLDNFPPDF